MASEKYSDFHHHGDEKRARMEQPWRYYFVNDHRSSKLGG